MNVSDKHYLTEKTLVNFLLNEIDPSGICNKALKPYKFRPDYVSNKNMLVVEFDGYLHYTKAKTVLDDLEKDKILSQMGYNVIRIPYFVQLDNKVMDHLFGSLIYKSFDYVKYPHGFIDVKAVLPADFCSLGIQRFKADLIRFSFIKDEIITSMHNKQNRKSEVFPINFDL